MVCLLVKREAYEMTKLAAAYNRPNAWHFRGTEAADANGIIEPKTNSRFEHLSEH